MSAPKGGAGNRSRGPRRGAHSKEPRTASDAPGIAPETLVYGRHPVREVLRGPRTVHQLHMTPNTRRDLADDLPADVPVRERDSQALAMLAGTGDHQGVVAEVDPFGYCTIHDLLAAPGVPLILCLDQVTDPHNLGAIARVCEASGATGIVVPQHRSAHVTGAVCKASAGAVEHVRIAMVTNIADTLARVKGPDLWAYGASERGTRAYTDPEYDDGVIFVFGSEGAGIRPRVQEHCDELLQVPMRGNVSSLNVATVTALFAYEVVRQRGGVAPE